MRFKGSTYGRKETGKPALLVTAHFQGCATDKIATRPSHGMFGSQEFSRPSIVKEFSLKNMHLMGSTSFLLLILVGLSAANRLQTKLDVLDNAYPPNTPNIPEVTGPFTITVVARFDNIGGGHYQRLVDFGDGPITNNIVFGQVRNTTKIRLKYWLNDRLGTTYQLSASNAITEGTTDTWEAGVDATGLATIKKNGLELG